jgi:DNA-directed RNA polymerase specialized sigma24 family protein
MSRQENPAKVFLRRYKALSGRVDALQRAIDEALARATNTAVTLKEIKVLSSPAEHDPMARDVCAAVDACEILYQYKAEAETALREILAAIDSLKDERQKELLTRRYITGEGFPEICEAMHYERTQVFVIHGRALIEINKRLKEVSGDGRTDIAV